MVVTPIDFFNRRTAAILFNIELVNKWKQQVIAYMGVRFNWTDHDKKTYSQQLEEALKSAIIPEEREKV